MCRGAGRSPETRPGPRSRGQVGCSVATCQGKTLLRRRSIHHPVAERLFRVLDGESGAPDAHFRFRLAGAL